MESIDEIYKILDPEARKEFNDLAKYQLRKSMEKCGLNNYPGLMMPNTDGEIFVLDRVSGECICNICKQKYYDHPLDWRIIGYNNIPFLNILCDGTRVKL